MSWALCIYSHLPLAVLYSRYVFSRGKLSFQSYSILNSIGVEEQKFHPYHKKKIENEHLLPSCPFGLPHTGPLDGPYTSPLSPGCWAYTSYWPHLTRHQPQLVSYFQVFLDFSTDNSILVPPRSSHLEAYVITFLCSLWRVGGRGAKQVLTRLFDQTPFESTLLTLKT